MKAAGDLRVTVTLTPEMQKAIQWFYDQCATGECGPDEQAGIAEVMIRLALAHPREIVAWMDAFARYRDAEGLIEDPQTPFKLLTARVGEPREYPQVQR